jgi:hypothetical protein
MDSDLLPSSSDEQNQTFNNTQFSSWHVFKRHIPRFLMTILIDIILPLGIYFGLQKSIKPVYALICAGTSPFFMVIIKAILSRTFDALGFIVFIGFVISAIIGVTTQDPTLFLLGHSLIAGVISSTFTISLIPFYRCHHRLQIRPLIYYLYKDFIPTKREQLGLPKSIFIDKQDSKDENEVLIPKVSDKQEVSRVYEWMYTTCPSFRRSCYLVTAIWSIGLSFSFLGQVTLILLHLSINTIVIYGHVKLASVVIICIILSIICIKRERKQTMIYIEEWKKEHLKLQ